MNPPRSALVLVLLFALGSITGYALSRGNSRRENAQIQRNPAAVVDHFLARKQAEYAKALGFTPEQSAASARALDSVRARLLAHHEASRKAVFTIMDVYRQELRAALTPEQTAKLDAAIESYRKPDPQP